MFAATLRKIRQAFRRPAAVEPSLHPPRREPPRRQARRWEAAETTRLNSAHWTNAADNSLNSDLAAKLAILRARCALEIANNPWVDGAVETHAGDVVGPHGPRLDVQSDSDRFNERLETLWTDWTADPTTRRDLDLAGTLRLWVRDLWTTGDLLGQMTSRKNPPGPLALALRLIPPRRLGTPYAAAGQANICLGVERAGDGAPVAYHVDDPEFFGASEVSTRSRRILARWILHYFKVTEAEQARGFPWLSPCLDAMADLRDFDAETLDAARQAADMAVFWYTDHQDVAPMVVNESTEIERRQQQTGPPGWKPQQLTPQQPNTVYNDYRAERLRELGRPVGMPLMTVRLDSTNHNYSSARFDGQNYNRGLETVQAWLSAQPLRRLVDELAAEATAANFLPKRPPRVVYAWTWPVRPHVDPAKEANAEKTRLANGTLTYSAALAAHGTTLETVIAQRRRENRLLADAGLPPLPTWPAPPPTAAAPPSRGFTVPVPANGHARP